VPPGGRAASSWDREQVADRQVSIKLLGFGYGSGRKLTVSLR